MLRPGGPGWTERVEDGFVVHLDAPGDAHLAFAASVARGLEGRPRRLEPRFIYDALGSQVYEEITRLDEYYPTRTEDSILARYAPQLAEHVGPTTLVELGSGSSTKTRRLLQAWRDRGLVAYVPIDVSPSAVIGACRDLRERFPGLAVEGVASTFRRGLQLVSELHPKTLVFLGSTLGNFEPHEVDRFLRNVARSLAPGDHFLLGIDLAKQPDVLEAAYADPAGVTERFILNVFGRMNRELDAGIDVDALRMDSLYDVERQRVEMWARVLEPQVVRVAPLGRSFRLAAGERILVEVSRKFLVDQVAAEASRFDLTVRDVFTDERRWFAVLLLQRATGPGGRPMTGTSRNPAPDRPSAAPVGEWRVVPGEPGFRLGACPVTCGEWRAFVEAGGYADSASWTPDGWAWRQRHSVEAPLGWVLAPDGRWWIHGVNLDHLQPVTGVSWYEAQAFCAWLGVRLPTEREWQCAAAWDPEHGRERPWPWGDAPPDPRRVNAGGGLPGPTAVGSYPRSLSFFGHHQLLGDVWEWVQRGVGPTLAGGAFDTPMEELVCSLRRAAPPDLRDPTVGLRLASER